ncbi:porin family protein [Adhaeribacter rhizoryzae]|uniref:PorT family protein n=1 Tax=Adhaeribacter rhizoryzae TaxID=2607907 RepID=A0A5M6DDV4_9BACT|nr:porin family protein [Adhaeribacter rhizoryzae]KAA5543385.1 PorT family protein [Adhaeribacter rhizoryzae]
MKKITFLLLAILLSTAGFAQKRVTTTAPINHNLEGSTAPENTGFGIKGGLNFSDVRNTDGGVNFDPKTSYHVGAFAQFSITDWFSLQPEVIYSRKGYDSTNVARRLDYFDVPLLLVFNPLDNVSIHVGPQVSLLMTVKDGDKEINKEDSYNSLDYGMVGGVEARLSIFRFGARYNLGLNQIYQDTYRDIATNVNRDMKNGAFQVYVGVGFH